MKLPFSNNARTAKSKLTDYLLSDTHPTGRTKAKLFIQLGYSAEEWDVLAHDLTTLAQNNEITNEERTPFGVRYVIEGELQTPSGKTLVLRTIWFIDNDEQIPHFVTAYPR